MKKFFIGLMTLLAVTNGAIWHAVYLESARHELTVAFLDIGQGDAIFIEAPNGNQILVDGGPDAKVLHELGAVMPWYDKSLDMIVITNPDKDHIAGFIDILKRFDVGSVLEPGTQSKTLTHTTLQELIKEKEIPKTLARRGMKIILDDTPGREVILTVLFPDRDVSMETTNDGSIVARLTYGETEVMLTGDAPIGVENHLLSITDSSTPQFLRLESDILKAGHHGSKTSSSEEFVKMVNPQYAVISCGKENKYGHPNDETLATLAKFPLKLFRTDQLGTIIMKSDGKKFTRVE